MKKNVIGEVIAALLVFLFIYAALSKLLDFDKFRYQLSQSPFIANISRFIVWVIPFGEILISALLISRRTRFAGLYLSFFLMLLFTGYLFIMLKYSSYLPCSCGGFLAELSWPAHLVFNGAFIVLGLLSIKMINKSNTNPQ